MAKRSVSSPQLELSFDASEKPRSQKALEEPPAAARQDEAAQVNKPAEHTYVKVTAYKPNSRDHVFRRRVKQEGDYRCEQCGLKFQPENLCVHHILETRATFGAVTGPICLGSKASLARARIRSVG